MYLNFRTHTKFVSFVVPQQQSVTGGRHRKGASQKRYATALAADKPFFLEKQGGVHKLTMSLLPNMV